MVIEFGQEVQFLGKSPKGSSAQVLVTSSLDRYVALKKTKILTSTFKAVFSFPNYQYTTGFPRTVSNQK